MWRDFLFEIVTEDSDLCGERFFVELFDVGFKTALRYALDEFPEEELKYLGEFTPEEADALGYDTY